jgi:signal transduction histidine kinase
MTDSTGLLSVNQALGVDQWEPVNQRLINFGITDASVWLRFSLLRSNSETRYYLNSGYRGIDSLEAFVIHESRDGSVRSVKMAPALEEPFLSGYVEFAIELPKDGIASVYLRASGTGPLLMPLTLRSFEQVVEKGAGFSLEKAIAGALLIIILFQSAIMWALDRGSFRRYICMAGLALVWLASFYGEMTPIAENLGIKSAVVWRLGVFCLVLTLLAGALFIKGVFFSEIRTRAGLQVYRFVCLSSVLFAIASFWMDLKTSLTVFNYFGISLSVLGVVMVKEMDERKTLPLKMAAPAFVVLVLGFAVTHAVTLEYPIISDPTWMAHSALFGVLVQLAVLGVVAFYRVIVQQRELYEAHAQLYQAEKLHSLGGLADGIIANIKSPLTEIDGVFTRFGVERNGAESLSRRGTALAQDILGYLKSLYVFAYPSPFEEREKIRLTEIVEEVRVLGRASSKNVVLENQVDPLIEVFGSRTYLTLAILNILSWVTERIPCRDAQGELAVVFWARKDRLSDVIEISVTSSPGIVWQAEIESEVEDSATVVKKLPISKRILQDHDGDLSITDGGDGYISIKAFMVTAPNFPAHRSKAIGGP